MKARLKILTVLIVVTAFIVSFSDQSYAEGTQDDIGLVAGSAILVDAGTGQVLYSKNADEPLPPASMTKMMSEYLVEKAISDGKLKWTDKVTASAYAGWMGQNYNASRAYIEKDKTYTVRDLFKVMVVESADDATVALAEKVAGSEKNFVDMMNETAKKFAMTETHYQDATGYPYDEIPKKYQTGISGKHVMSARDSAILAYHLIKTYPDALTASKLKTITFNNLTFTNTDWMLPGFVSYYKGVDGLKTGYTDDAGYCFTGTAKRHGIRLISVVMKTNREVDRFIQTKKLLDYGFNNFTEKTLLKLNQTTKDNKNVSVPNGKSAKLTALVDKNLIVTVQNNNKAQYSVKFNEKMYNAPIKKGDNLETVRVKYKDGTTPVYLDSQIQKEKEVHLVSATNDDKANWFVLLMRQIGQIF